MQAAKATRLMVAVCKDPCLPGLNTRSIIFKAAPFAVSRCRVTLGKLGPRRLPALPPRPTARFIEDNTALCYIRRLRCHTDSAAVPSGRAIPIALLSVRQLVGIRHANP